MAPLRFENGTMWKLVVVSCCGATIQVCSVFEFVPFCPILVPPRRPQIRLFGWEWMDFGWVFPKKLKRQPAGGTPAGATETVALPHVWNRRSVFVHRPLAFSVNSGQFWSVFQRGVKWLTQLKQLNWSLFILRLLYHGFWGVRGQGQFLTCLCVPISAYACQ